MLNKWTNVEKGRVLNRESMRMNTLTQRVSTVAFVNQVLCWTPAWLSISSFIELFPYEKNHGNPSTASNILALRMSKPLPFQWFLDFPWSILGSITKRRIWLLFPGPQVFFFEEQELKYKKIAREEPSDSGL